MVAVESQVYDPARLADAATRSHQVVTVVDIMFNGAVVRENVNVIDGSVTFDRNAEVFARLDISIEEPSLVGTLLRPYGYELAVRRGIRYSTFDEMVYLGVFPIQSAGVNGVSLRSSITAEDRSRLIRDARFEDDYSVAAGVNYATAIQALLDSAVPGLEYLFQSTSHVTPLLTFIAQDDRWVAAQKMARSIGCELFFDGLGRPVLRSVTAASTQAWTIAEGEHGVLVDASIDQDRDDAYNRWIHLSANASLGAQYRGVATDTDPASPTYYDGLFGHKPKFFSSEFFTTNAQCIASAEADKARSIGVARSFQFSFSPNPAIRAGDTIRLQRSALALDELIIIDSLTIPLGPEGVSTATGRSQQVAA